VAPSDLLFLDPPWGPVAITFQRTERLLCGGKLLPPAPAIPDPTLSLSIPKDSMHKSFYTLLATLEQHQHAETCAVRATDQSPDCTGAPGWRQSLGLEPSMLWPEQLRQHRRLPKLPLTSTSKWLHHYWEQEGSKARQVTSSWNSSCTISSPKLGLSRSHSSNIGSCCAAN